MTMRKSIYNIEREYLDIAEMLQENGGELTTETEIALAINKEELQVKAANYGYVVKSMLDTNVNIDAEIERLNALKLINVKTIERLKYSVENAMKIYGIEEIKVNNIKISFRKSTSTLIENENLIPKKYFQTKPAIKTVSLKMVGDALKAGIKVKGASLSDNKKLQIK